ncbi:NAD(P)H-dependent oxidoreductase subunit E [Deinococcus sp.]|uniref:NAD(P)H-dependent oxidoreductase subunit E n=1 Tax=Deinococcus sp. TaxID=47478 RepID=UPI003C79E449
MPVTRIELCINGLPVDLREALLETIWNELRISPGMVTSDGNTELALSQDSVAPDDAPLVTIGGQPYYRMTPERLSALLRRRGTR